MPLYHWTNQIKSMFPNLSKPQATVLAAFSFGIAKAKSCALNEVARGLTFLGIPDTVETRLRRFISNPRVDMAKSCENLARSVIRALPRKKPVILLVDETSLHDRLKAMVVSVAYEGRAIPVAMMTYHQTKWPMGQVKMITKMLRWVRDGAGGGRDLIVMADRGIGTSPNLLKAIEGLGMHYMMRVSKIVRVMMDDETEFPFKSLTVEPGKSWRAKAKAFKNAGWIECWAECVHGDGHDEPWYLVTNYPHIRGRKYGMRMWEELTFRDYKSGGWQWQKSRVWKPERADMLWLAMSAAYVWMLSLGAKVCLSPKIQRVAVGRNVNGVNVFRLGLILFQNRLSERRRIPYALNLPTGLRAAKKV